jgi:23S rRNA pseudouridine2605 synthase
MERLQKVIAQAGICSRRKAEELIVSGKVRVNGQVCSELGTKVSASDEIVVNGKPLEKENKVYYVIHKPKSCICSNKDQFDRKTVLDYLPADKRIFTVGRLDYDTSGVLICTNDGKFANELMHPRYHINKTYLINLDGILSDDDVRALRKGLVTKDETYLPAKVFIKQKDYTRGRTQLELTIQEGKNHQVKNMMEALGHKVRRLHRSKFGGITADDLKPGEYRILKNKEIKDLKAMAMEGLQK